MAFLYGLNKLRFGGLMLITGLLLCFTACGPKAIPYSQSRDVPEPNAVAVAHYNWGMTYANDGNFGQAIMELSLAIEHEPLSTYKGTDGSGETNSFSVLSVGGDVLPQVCDPERLGQFQ